MSYRPGFCCALNSYFMIMIMIKDIPSQVRRGSGFVSLSIFYCSAALLAMQSAVLATAIPSVCLSVRHTLVYPIQTDEHRIKLSLLQDSKNTSFLTPTVVGGDVPFHLKFALKVTHPL